MKETGTQDQMKWNQIQMNEEKCIDNILANETE